MAKEEKKIKAAENAVTPEMGAKMQAMLQQANERIQQIVAQARQMEQMLRDRTIDHMFDVMKYSHEFDPEFVEKCANAITAYISNIAFEQEEEQTQEETAVTPLASQPEVTE